MGKLVMLSSMLWSGTVLSYVNLAEGPFVISK
jgi:hypothetical protein